MRIAEFRKSDLFPTCAGRKTRIVKVALASRLRQTDDGNEPECRARRVILGRNQRDKVLKRRARRPEDFGYAFGRRPARLAVGSSRAYSY